MLANGEDPKAARTKDDHVPTFAEAADAYVKAMKSSWKNDKLKAQRVMTLKTYAEPIRGLPVGKVATQDMLDLLQSLWNEPLRSPRGCGGASRMSWTLQKPKANSMARTRPGGEDISTSSYPSGSV